MIKFTRHYVDRSNDTGFQFQFYCDRHSYHGIWCYRTCSNMFLSTYEPNPLGVASKLGQAVSYLTGKGHGLGIAGDLANRVYKPQAWQDAFKRAIEEAKQEFEQCPRCAAWVCHNNCWNDKAQLCYHCAPDLQAEASAIKTHMAVDQMVQKIVSEDQLKDVTINDAQPTRCGHCGERNHGGKFCVACGKEVAKKRFCVECGKPQANGSSVRFCADCGAKLP